MNGLWPVFGVGGAAQAVAWALVHFLWQGALVALALAGALALGRGWSGRLRYALSAGAMLAMLVLPVATAVTLSSERPTGSLTSANGSSFLSPLSLRGSGREMEERPGVRALFGTAGPRARLETRLGPRLEPILPAVFSAWVLGVVLLSVYHLGGWFQARRLTRRDARPAAAAWTVRLGELRQRLGILRTVKLLESARVAVPSVVGWLRPVILVPASVFSGLSPQQLEAVLAHELAHVRRHDYLINLLQTAVETLLFYHPAVWWASRQVRIERESCCDDLALAVCGDRVGYARALAALEGLRAPAPRLAMAALGGGGSLLARIRRIVGAPPPPAGRSDAWLTGAVAVLTLFASLAVQRTSVSAEPAVPVTAPVQMAAAQPARPPAPPAPAPPALPAARPAPPAPPAPPPPAPPAPPAPAAPALASVSTNRGTWKAERRKDGIQLDMEIREDGPHGHHHMQESDLYPEKDFTGLGSGSGFELRRAAGTFHFTGRFDGGHGEGTFTFQGNPGYVKEMASLGYTVKEDNLLQLALFDVSPQFVHDLGSLGYTRVPFDRLIQFRIHGVSTDFIRALNAAGYRNVPPDRLVQFRIHGVKPELIQALNGLGLKNPAPEELINLQIHGASPDYIRAMAAEGYKGLTAEDLVRFRIHGVTPEYVRELAAAGYRNVNAEDLVRFRIHGVTADFIRDQERKGRRNLSPDELVDLRIHSR
jgi:beta-lactamase regulating signal transducer with metallopeptidase domain